MNVLVTGGAGFIGRWVVNELIDKKHNVWVLDNLSNGELSNIDEFQGNHNFKDFIKGDINDSEVLSSVFEQKFDVCYHLAASINVQDSIDDPISTFENDVTGTFAVLEKCRISQTKMVFMSTCMVYDMAGNDTGITEKSALKPASPYAGSKIAGENLVLSYYYAYGLPTVVVRPFNTYGPYQKVGGEGGVVSIFIKQKLCGGNLNIYGTGEQTRDLLYVSDCAEFVVSAGFNDNVNGEIVNAGSGRDISINELASLICGDKDIIRHVPHIHPQSEINKLLCNYEKAEKLLGFAPKVSLSSGLYLTENWIKGHILKNDNIYQ